MNLTPKEFTGMLMSGKGSLRRIQSNDERKRFEDGWMRVFGKARAKPKNSKARKKK